jgi:hypothetical protein
VLGDELGYFLFQGTETLLYKALAEVLPSTQFCEYLLKFARESVLDEFLQLLRVCSSFQVEQLIRLQVYVITVGVAPYTRVMISKFELFTHFVLFCLLIANIFFFPFIVGHVFGDFRDVFKERVFSSSHFQLGFGHNRRHILLISIILSFVFWTPQWIFLVLDIVLHLRWLFRQLLCVLALLLCLAISQGK